MVQNIIPEMAIIFREFMSDLDVIHTKDAQIKTIGRYCKLLISNLLLMIKKHKPANKESSADPLIAPCFQFILKKYVVVAQIIDVIKIKIIFLKSKLIISRFVKWFPIGKENIILLKITLIKAIVPNFHQTQLNEFFVRTKMIPEINQAIKTIVIFSNINPELIPTKAQQ